MFRIKSVLVCDDVRIESNGKFLLIGVYTGGMLFSSPGEMALPSLRAFVTGFTDMPIIDCDFRVRLENSDSVLITSKIHLERTDTALAGEARIDVPVPIGPIQFLGAGKYYIEYRFESEEWQFAESFDVLLAATP